jgi:hypothetical protein
LTFLKDKGYILVENFEEAREFITIDIKEISEKIRYDPNKDIYAFNFDTSKVEHVTETTEGLMFTDGDCENFYHSLMEISFKNKNKSIYPVINRSGINEKFERMAFCGNFYDNYEKIILINPINNLPEVLSQNNMILIIRDHIAFKLLLFQQSYIFEALVAVVCVNEHTC